MLSVAANAEFVSAAGAACSRAVVPGQHWPGPELILSPATMQG